ncbi:MAG: DUF2281 domain-containing protein [Microcystaceae cyanobacterium]
MTITNHQITQNIIDKLQKKPLDKQQQILDYMESLCTEDQKSLSFHNKRVFWLHQGKILISDDFNNHLPD